ncbi:MAG: acetolactate synthase small subunit [Actinomycetes bacterium]|jgi:acetolactate synthase-1/3 small subunit|nr:acetolactate synthase small subunit [Actinomycetes bacterium]
MSSQTTNQTTSQTDRTDRGNRTNQGGQTTHHTLSILVGNKPGTLTRVTSLFARRGYNIEALVVGQTEDPARSRITMIVGVEGTPLEQIIKQTMKLINVVDVRELPPNSTISQELRRGAHGTYLLKN